MSDYRRIDVLERRVKDLEETIQELLKIPADPGSFEEKYIAEKQKNWTLVNENQRLKTLVNQIAKLYNEADEQLEALNDSGYQALQYH